jgi:hypothetical protein
MIIWRVKVVRSASQESGYVFATSKELADKIRADLVLREPENHVFIDRVPVLEDWPDKPPYEEVGG